MKRKSLSLALIAAAVLPSLQAGEDSPTLIPEEPAKTSNPGDWEVKLTPYLWMAGIKGETGPAALVAPVDMSFGDIWDNLDMSFMAAAEISRGRWSLQTNLTWIDLSSSSNGRGLLYDTVDLDLEQTILDVRIGYRVLEGRTNIDLVAGARYMSVDTDISFKGGLLDRKVGISEDWIDPLIGFRISHTFNDKWLGVIRADYGGFGVSSESVWELFGGIGYRLTDRTTVFGGYRYLDVDYDRDFVLNAEMKGFIIGTQFTF